MGIGTITGVILGFLIKRYVPPRRSIELIEPKCKKEGTSIEGGIYLRLQPLVRYDGPEVLPLPKVRWIPKKRTDRETLSVKSGNEYRETDLVIEDSKRNAWPKGLRMSDGETFKLNIYMTFPADLWKVWREKEIPGRILIPYGKKKFLKFDHSIQF